MQRLEHARRRGTRAAPGVDDARRAERARQLAWMRGAVALDMVQDLPREAGMLALDAPRLVPATRVQKVERRLRQYAIDVHEALDKRQLGKARFQIAGAIVDDALAQTQVLCPGG